MEPHNAYAITTLEIEDVEIEIRLELEYVPESIPPRDHIGRPLEPPEAAGYVIIGAEWRNPFEQSFLAVSRSGNRKMKLSDMPWESVPSLIYDLIKANERELLERADVEVAV